MPSLIFCHPITNCYHRKLDEHGTASGHAPGVPTMGNDTGTGTDGSLPVAIQPISYSSVVAPRPASAPETLGAAAPAPGERYSSSFFMGLTFANGLRSLDLTSTIQDFVYRVSIFEGKTRDMNVAITALQPADLPDFALSMYEDSGSVQMTPMSTPVRPPAPDGAPPLSAADMVIPASAMSVVACDVAIAPSMGSGNVVKTLWGDKDDAHKNECHGYSQESALSIEEEGWVDTSMEIATPAVAENRGSRGRGSSDFGSSQGRRRDRSTGKDGNNPNGCPLPPIDLIRTRAMSFDTTAAVGADEDSGEGISPFKKSRACKVTTAKKNTNNNNR
jgi:hypothetical protein